MKLLASDYDKTFRTNVKTLKLNIASINRFRQNGNKFAIVTGRSFVSIKKEIEKYNIKYDYLVCNNGLIIFDNNDNIINYSILNQENLMTIYNEILYANNVIDNSLYGFYTSTYNLENILEVYVKFRKVKFAKKFKKYIEKRKPKLFCYIENKNLFISNNITKADAVRVIQDIENINLEDVYTIGDYKNDINMLEQFNGYKMLCSHPKLLLKKVPMIRGVSYLVDKISK